ncbi:hypothetical protein [Sphingomonas sp.]|uniref:hypothetical protein n=1 Tax=Sphingomonas sp. TaxID=28214 RepID=UPI0035A8CD81
MTDTAEYELVELRRQDKPDIAFEGRLLAFADNKDEAEANPRKSAARWTELSVYELRDGSWVAVSEAISDKPGEVDFGEAHVIGDQWIPTYHLGGTDFSYAEADKRREKVPDRERHRRAMDFFGWTWLAKKLAADAGWDVVERLDRDIAKTGEN